MVKHLSEESRKRIQSLVKSGKRAKTVAGMLDCSLNTVYKWANSPPIVENTKAKRRHGPLPILHGVLAKKVDKLLDDRRNLGSRTITPIINKRFKIDISARSIRRFQKAQGFGYGKDLKKPVLTDKMKKDRLQWAKTHLKDDFRHWIYSDSKIFRIGTDGIRKRQRGKRGINAKDKWGGQFHVWWAFSYHRIYPPQVLKTTLNATEYVKLLQKTLGKHYDRGDIYIQDKASCNTSKKASNWLNEHHIPYCKDWPTKGVDLNVIENVFGTLEQKKREKDFHNVSKMKNFVMKEMKKFSIMGIRQYIDSMPARMQAVIKAKGGYTKYF